MAVQQCDNTADVVNIDVDSSIDAAVSGAIKAIGKVVRVRCPSTL